MEVPVSGAGLAAAGVTLYLALLAGAALRPPRLPPWVAPACRWAARGVTVVALAALALRWSQREHDTVTLAQLQQALTAERACERAPVCLDERARNASYDVEYPVQSRTGRFFFQGQLCAGDCRETARGYAYAQRAGITRREGCQGPDAFVDGCLLAVEPADPHVSEQYGHEPEPE